MRKFRLGVITGLAVGYYFGTKAGRERYVQLRRLFGRVPSIAKVQAAADLARERFRPTPPAVPPAVVVPPSPN